VIRHPGAALIVPFLDNNTVIFIRQYRPVINGYIWELPAGTLNKKEDILFCAKRELKEETGYAAARWRKIGFIYPAPGYTTERIHIFTAASLKKVQTEKEEDEIIVTEMFSRNGVARLFRAGKIVDAKTICALALTGVLG